MSNTPGILGLAFNQYIDGELLSSNALMNDNDATRQLVGEAVSMLAGSINALPTTSSSMGSPLSAFISNNTLLVGGSGQMAFVNGRLVDNCPQTAFAIPINSSQSVRTDTLYVAYNQSQVNPSIVPVESTTYTLSNQTVYQLWESLVYAYVVGSGTPPPGNAWQAFANISVPPNSSPTLNILFPTFSQLISSQVVSGVSSLNGVGGALTLSAGTGINVTTSGKIITVNNTGVTSVNTVTGPVNIAQGSGISVAQSGQNITVGNTGVTGLQIPSGQIRTGNLTLQALNDLASNQSSLRLVDQGNGTFSLQTVLPSTTTQPVWALISSSTTSFQNTISIPYDPYWGSRTYIIYYHFFCAMSATTPYSAISITQSSTYPSAVTNFQAQHIATDAGGGVYMGSATATVTTTSASGNVSITFTTTTTTNQFSAGFVWMHPVKINAL